MKMYQLGLMNQLILLLKNIEMVYIIIVFYGYEDYIKKLFENFNVDDEYYKIIVCDNKDFLLLK